MPKLHPFLFAALLATGLSPLNASAQTTQAWVSGHGSDSSNCGGVSSPCRTFQYAHDHIVAAGGEIDVLDPADYGPVAISKAIGIVNDGAGAATINQIAPGMNAVAIAAGPGDLIHLRGLSLNGMGAAANGVSLNSAGQLEIVNCVIRRFMSHGVDLEPSTALSFTIKNLVASQNANASVNLRPSANMTGSIEGLMASFSVNGLQLDGSVSAAASNVFVAVTRSSSSNNNNGFYAGSLSGSASVKMVISDSTATGNGTAVYAGPGAQIAVARSNLVGNGEAAYSGSTGGVETQVDNNLIFNGMLLSGPGTASAYPQR